MIYSTMHIAQVVFFNKGFMIWKRKVCVFQFKRLPKNMKYKIILYIPEVLQNRHFHVLRSLVTTKVMIV